MASGTFTIPQDVQITDLLPPAAVAAIKEYAREYQLEPNQVIELALAQFLDFNAVTLSGFEYKTIAQMQEEIACLKAEVAGLKQQVQPNTSESTN